MPSIVIIIVVSFVMFSATFYNISAISWRSALLVEETGVPTYRPAECQ
jgi:hypothetical protein